MNRVNMTVTSATGWFVVSIHDVAPSTFAETRAWAADLDARGVASCLLVVPGPWREPHFEPSCELAAWLRERVQQGDEVAQHGWTHRAAQDGSPWRRVTGWAAARGSAELWSIDVESARRSLAAGRDLLGRAGLRPLGVTPPGYLACASAVQAMRELGYRYTTSHRFVLDLYDNRRLAAPALSHRTGRAGERIGRSIIVHGVRQRARHRAPVRLALHPGDLHRRSLRDVTLRAIDAALDAGLTPTTYERLVA